MTMYALVIKQVSQSHKSTVITKHTHTQSLQAVIVLKT